MLFDDLDMKDPKKMDDEDAEFGDVELVDQNNPWGDDGSGSSKNPIKSTIAKAKSLVQSLYIKFMTMDPKQQKVAGGSLFVVFLVFLAAISGSGSKEPVKIGVPLLPLATHIDKVASQMYPDGFPDLLFLLEQRQVVDVDKLVNESRNITQYVLLQSMNTYWKQAHPFRKNQLPQNQELMENAVRILNRNVPSLEELQTGKLENPKNPYAQFHLRVHQAGGSLPFFTNWRVYYYDQDAECENYYNVPIFQRAIPKECDEGKNFWTIATAPILQQLKPRFGAVMNRGDNQHQAVVVAPPVINDHSMPTGDVSADIIATSIHQVVSVLKEKAQEEIPEKLVFLPDEQEKKNYDEYTAVLDLDTTGAQYPSLLCQHSVVLRLQDGMEDVLDSTLEPWVHYVPIEFDPNDEQSWSHVRKQIDHVLSSKNAEEMNKVVENANEWCHQYKNKEYMAERFVQSLRELVDRLDVADELWTQQWKDHKEVYLQGHWMREPGGDSWSIPKSVVEAIKSTGLRADDPKVDELWSGDNEGE